MMKQFNRKGEYVGTNPLLQEVYFSQSREDRKGIYIALGGAVLSIASFAVFMVIAR